MTSIDVLDKIIIPLISAFIGAALAFKYQINIELKRDKRLVIQNLMMYRNVGAQELEWIKALNVIDIVFHNDKEVTKLFHLFLVQTRPPLFQNNEYVRTYNLMIFEMAKCSDYKNLTMNDIENCYSPEGLVQHYPNMPSVNAPLVSPSTDLLPTNSDKLSKD